MEAYQRHEITRETRSLLFCVQALLDALDLGESLKTYGLHFKMTHDDPRLYLIGHASLEKRGLSIGQANIKFHLPDAGAGASTVSPLFITTAAG